MRFELNLIVDYDCAVDVALHFDEGVEDFDQVRFVIVPSEAVCLTFSAAHLSGKRRRGKERVRFFFLIFF